jgi:hypothetical protein
VARPPNTLKHRTQPNEQRESAHNSINRDKATCLGTVMPRNDDEANKQQCKGTLAPEDGRLLVTETRRVTRDTNILMF